MFSLVFTTLTVLICTYIEVVYQAEVEAAGSAMILWMQSHASHSLDLIFEVLGEITGAMFLSASGAIYLLGYKEIGFLGSYSGFLGAAFSGTLKMLILHPRPFLKEPLIHNFTCSSDWGSPSGHASSAGAAMWVLAYFWTKDNKYIPAKVLFFAVCTVIIAVDRVYLGVHYPFQVVLGYAYSVWVGHYFISTSHKYFTQDLKDVVWHEHLKIAIYAIINTVIYNISEPVVQDSWRANYRAKCGKDFTLEAAMAKNYNESLYPLIVAGILLGFFYTRGQVYRHSGIKAFVAGNAVCVALIVYCLVVDKICLKFLPYGLRMAALAVNRYFSGFCIGYGGPKAMMWLRSRGMDGKVD